MRTPPGVGRTRRVVRTGLRAVRHRGHPCRVSGHGQTPSWDPGRPKISVPHLLVAWLTSALAVFVAAWIVPGFHLEDPLSAILVAAAIAIVNAVLPPVIAALRLPATLVLGFLLVLAVDAAALVLADRTLEGNVSVDGFGDALLAAIVIAALTIAIAVVLGTNDDDRYTLRVIERIARRQRQRKLSDTPGIVFLEIDGLGLPILRAAMQDGYAPNLARWAADDGYQLTEWETDLSSQTGASQAGILLGSNEGIPAFRWYERDTRKVMTCSAPKDCAEIERRVSTGRGLLADGGASRGNLLSGDAEEAILTVSRIDAEIKANPGYRDFLANGFNVSRALALFVAEVVIEWTSAARAKRRDVRPRGHRGGKYPFLRGAMCVVVRDLVVSGVLGDMMRGRPAVYATFASYDEVAHHSGLRRADTMEALRKLDQQFGRIARAREFAARPYEIVVLSDHGQTQGATFKQRNGYGLDELVDEHLEGSVLDRSGGDEQAAMVGMAAAEATGRRADEEKQPGVPDSGALVMGSGNLGLVYLVESDHRLTIEELNDQHPGLVDAIAGHPHVGWVLVDSAEQGPLIIGNEGRRIPRDGRVEGRDPLEHFSPSAEAHILRTDGFTHVPDLLVGSFYDTELEEGCAFEELISFHGGLGGPQTRPFILHPEHLEAPEEIIGAASVYDVLRGWRAELQGPGPEGTTEAREVPT